MSHDEIFHESGYDSLDEEEIEWRRQGLSPSDIFKKEEERALRKHSEAAAGLQAKMFGAKNFAELMARPEYEETPLEEMVNFGRRVSAPIEEKRETKRKDARRRQTELAESLMNSIIDDVPSPGDNHFEGYNEKKRKKISLEVPKTPEFKKAIISTPSNSDPHQKKIIEFNVSPGYLKPTCSSKNKTKATSPKPKITDIEKNRRTTTFRKPGTELQLVKRDIILPDQTNENLRRSSRVRVEPVRFWLGEEPIYFTSPGGGRHLQGVTDVIIEDKKAHEFRTPQVKLATEARSASRRLAARETLLNFE